ncbi:cutinase family protein [Actinomadura rupiterrae]|uniref:cutinase family protein n=1 Tax=Actinomadura rupiterrae TaxID=559627 RepID=UPI0020A59A2D|nr:cutinase family protein [Actinomadura rupiterrae]MCP2342583.1 cutinase [Actinomadura rupiterrae]
MNSVRWSIAGAGVALLGTAACGAPAAQAGRVAQDGRAAASACAPVSVISARGTTEPQSGSHLLKPIGTKILKRVPGATYTELRYPASWAKTSSNAGVTNLVKLLNDSARKCPKQRFVLLGYSQGAWVVGDALVAPAGRVSGKTAGLVGRAASGKIAAVAMFGDPRFNPKEPYDRGTFDRSKHGKIARPQGALSTYASRIQNYCNRGDLVCQTTGSWNAHLAYFTNGTPNQALTFVLSRLQG